LLGVASPGRRGCYFVYTPGTDSNRVIRHYTITAVSQSISTNQRKFSTDQSGVLRQTPDGSTPTASSNPI